MVKNKTTDVNFDDIYYNWIRRGQKRQTIRTPVKRWDVVKGDIVTAHFNGRNETLQLEIEETGYKAFKNITDVDAELESFKNRSELKEVLLIYYPNLIPANRVYYYRFKLVE